MTLYNLNFDHSDVFSNGTTNFTSPTVCFVPKMT